MKRSLHFFIAFLASVFIPCEVAEASADLGILIKINKINTFRVFFVDHLGASKLTATRAHFEVSIIFGEAVGASSDSRSFEYLA